MKKNKQLNLKELTVIQKSFAFYNATKIKKFTPYTTASSKSSMPESWKTRTYKAYPRFSQVLLPTPVPVTTDITGVLMHRRSVRTFTSMSIPVGQFGNLIYYAAGSTKFIDPTREDRRFYPSAGARYPLELYPFVFNVNTIPVGGYHYHVKTHSLENIMDSKYAPRIFDFFDQDWLKTSSALFVITGVFNRTEVKYGNRGQRHILTEYGHLAPNFYLLAEAMHLGCCSIGGFVDDGINRLLDLDFEDEGVIGVIAIGARDSKEATR